MCITNKQRINGGALLIVTFLPKKVKGFNNQLTNWFTDAVANGYGVYVKGITACGFINHVNWVFS